MYIKVVAYDPNWPHEFEKEAKEIQFALGDVALQIHHIGSTSVPGLLAKPVIDIMLEVSNLDALDAQSNEMKKLGYEVMGEYGIAGRRYFRKGGDNRTHQIHAFLEGDDNIVRHIAFRDYLIAHSKIAQDYGELKFKIAQNCNNDIDNYCDAKDPFIQYHEPLALKWYMGVKR